MRAPARAPRALPVLAALLLTVAAGCSGDDSGGESPQQLLDRATTTIDEAPSVHFTLTSTNVPPGEGIRLVSGEGVAARPRSFRGSLEVLLNGGTVSIELVSKDGTLYAKLPFARDFARTDPAQFGLPDPAKLIDQGTGLSRLVSEMTGATSAGEARIDGDVVTELNGQLPGQVVKDTLTSADPAQPVQVKAFVVNETGELRRAQLTGPFFEKGKNSIFTLVLDRYGDPVTVDVPSNVGSAPAPSPQPPATTPAG